MSLPSSKRLLEFLDSLPMTSDFDEWARHFSPALRALLGDVDRVSVGINFTDPEEEFLDQADPDLAISLSIYDNADSKEKMDQVVKSVERNGRPADAFVEEIRRLGYPIDRHQPHHGFDYYHNGSHLGSIVLWRDKGNPPISESTLEFMASIEPFLIYVLSDFSARYFQDRPAGIAFRRAMYRMFTQAELSMQEQKIIWLRMFGKSYKEIAELLSISVTTVKKHLNTIHRKTGTRSLAEVFGKYIAPYFELPSIDRK